ncbi:hypothetical protein, partial [Staphylococcus aureus]|uniref:hypothetical protein n=1 Tax=Staphylococcus aureus TaxID=1280 RepID=UPI00289C32A5
MLGVVFVGVCGLFCLVCGCGWGVCLCFVGGVVLWFVGVFWVVGLWGVVGFCFGLVGVCFGFFVVLGCCF